MIRKPDGRPGPRGLSSESKLLVLLLAVVAAMGFFALQTRINDEWTHSRSVGQASQFTHVPSNFSMTINVVTYNRHKSLARLCQSLLEADYMGNRVNLHFHVESGATKETVDFVDAFQWPHGQKAVRLRHRKGGLEISILESWYPAHDDDYVMFAEDDIEVAPDWYHWVLWTINTYRYGSKANRDPNIIGISLYTPREVETLYPKFVYHPYKEFADMGPVPYLLQMPCSWGAVYFPEHWRMFRKFMWRRSKITDVFIENCQCNGWTESWVKHLIEIMYLRGWYMLYPNFPNETSFSTNHMEVGTHIKENDTEHPKDRYTVPLAPRNYLARFYNEQRPAPAAQSLPILNLFNERIESREALRATGQSLYESLKCKDGLDCHELLKDLDTPDNVGQTRNTGL